jgi:hypothetical protein
MSEELEITAGMAFLDDQLSKLDEEEETVESPAPNESLKTDVPQVSHLLDDILRQAESVDQAIHGTVEAAEDDGIDLENLDLEWRFSTPSLRE